MIAALASVLGALLLDTEQPDLGGVRELRRRTGVSGAITKPRTGLLEALWDVKHEHGPLIMAMTAEALLRGQERFYDPVFARRVSGGEHNRWIEMMSHLRHIPIEDIDPELERIFTGIDDPVLVRVTRRIGRELARAMKISQEQYEAWAGGFVQRPEWLTDIICHLRDAPKERHAICRDAATLLAVFEEEGIVLPWEAGHLADVHSIDPAESWCAAPIGDVVVALCVMEGDISNLEYIIDWLDATGADLEAHSAIEADEAQQRWHEELGHGRFFGQPAPEALVVARWPDGATLQRLVTDADFRAEGERMGHCIGGQISTRTGRASGNSRYFEQSRRGFEASLSYRDADGVPRATMTFQMNSPPYEARLSQLQGPKDDAITDPVAVARLARLFLDTTHAKDPGIARPLSKLGVRTIAPYKRSIISREDAKIRDAMILRQLAWRDIEERDPRSLPEDLQRQMSYTKRIIDAATIALNEIGYRLPTERDGPGTVTSRHPALSKLDPQTLDHLDSRDCPVRVQWYTNDIDGRPARVVLEMPLGQREMSWSIEDRLTSEPLYGPVPSLTSLVTSMGMYREADEQLELIAAGADSPLQPVPKAAWNSSTPMFMNLVNNDLLEAG